MCVQTGAALLGSCLLPVRGCLHARRETARRCLLTGHLLPLRAAAAGRQSKELVPLLQFKPVADGSSFGAAVLAAAASTC